MKHLLFILSCTLSLGFLSCNSDSDDVADQFAKDIQLIENYLKEKNLTAEKTPQGVYYIIDVPGGAEKPKITNEIKIKYSGYFLDGEVFDSSNESQYIHLFNFIQGWQIGIPKFGIGGNFTHSDKINTEILYKKSKIQDFSNPCRIHHISR